MDDTLLDKTGRGKTVGACDGILGFCAERVSELSLLLIVIEVVDVEVILDDCTAGKGSESSVKCDLNSDCETKVGFD